ncbi:hypothetical protein A0256_23240 [Mucilaginibacter sp. PAMC 26640]|nr:hypothetical protein A0256_23240 [Mucilaginibacter sp. PAMC 26640]
MAKFGYAEYPVLRMLDEGKLGVIGFMDEDRVLTEDKLFIESFKQHFSTISPFFKKRRIYLTKPFCDAIGQSFNSLVRDEAWENIDTQWGVLLNMPRPFTQISIIYNIQNKNDKEFHDYNLIMFHKNIFMGIINQVGDKKEAQLSAYFYDLATDFCIKLGIKKDRIDVNEICNLVYTNLVATLNFIKYAPIETKQLPPNKKVKEMGVKYVNQSQNNINILDSKWFTTLIKSDAFKVRGHFRLQPCGVGLKDKKLIWINDFEKTGYNAPARKLSVE